MTVSQQILELLRLFIDASAKDPSQYAESKKDFTRKRKLPFNKLVVLMTGLLKKSLQSELNTFWGIMDENAPTKSAFCQARKKIKTLWFETFFKKTYEYFEQFAKLKKFLDYLVFACDSTVQKPPDNEETRSLGTHTNQSKTVASIKITTYHDVLNNITVRASINDKKVADLRTAQPFIAQLPINSISIYDRGFASQILPFLHGHYGSKYVIRLPVGFSNTVTNFMNSSDTDIIVTEQLTQKCCKELAKMGIRKSRNDTYTFRLVKVILPTGETEVLKTDLDSSFGIEELDYLYQSRWGIETCYNYFKNTLMLGTFSGYSKKAVIQDIYSVLAMYNLQTIIQYDCAEKLEEINERREKEYKINRNVGAGTARDGLKKIFLEAFGNIGAYLKIIQKIILKSLEMVKETHKERQRKMLRCNDRHQTELNYKRGF